MFNLKIWLISFIVIVMIAGWDLSSRVNQVAQEANVKNVYQPLILPKDIEVTEQTLAKIYALFERYDQVVKKETPSNKGKAQKKKVGMTQKDQEQQSGRVANFFVDNMQFNLKGIFVKSQRFAVLFRKNLENNKVDEVSLIEGQRLGAYLVKSITEDQIKFQFKDKEVQLSLF